MLIYLHDLCFECIFYFMEESICLAMFRRLDRVMFVLRKKMWEQPYEHEDHIFIY